MFEVLDGAPSREAFRLAGRAIPRIVGEFWTARQRQACSLHEISYRACFKPQLPRYFIERLTRPGDVVYDPFSGRGTTAVEAALLGRRVIANDVNPLGVILTAPRLRPPTLEVVADRLARIPNASQRAEVDLSMFFHPDTEREIVGLRSYLAARRQAGEEDDVDAWIRMVATNRLTGHSRGFFSVYTLPPNQAATPERQRRLNARLHQQPEYRDTRAIILRKTASLLRGLTEAQRANLRTAAESALLLTCDARSTPAIPDGGVQLTVTSPPFLDVVQYAADNWLRCWFNGIIADEIARRITLTRTPEAWAAVMQDVFKELYRVTQPGGWVAFEVGEVRRGRVRLDEHVAPIGESAGFTCAAILVNQQRFTKTAHIWGVANNACGTNTNRIVVFCKE
ncbi:DNA methyltransferase [Candidatus Roseilinea sp. NK_OTU-006]|uniref:DNA methyltransferase n=1 Tax=Candidatus Roseilinea sp. NK_OTU-006 TaxID=2704250 RepID=UPI002A5A1C2A|nr:DNA methyltransferase [Candidatus Roseilinea sp. NK_OTU-006]